MWFNYTFLFFLSTAISALLVPLVKRLAFKVGAVDVPSSERKIHKEPIPLLGGFAVIVTFLLVTVFYILYSHPDFHIVPVRFYFGVLLGAFILMVGGFLDDKWALPPKYQIVFPILATLVLINSGVGVGIKSISNPLGPNPINLDFKLIGITFSTIFIFLYMMVMIYTTKFLDGLDGLASGITFIAGLTLFFLSLSPGQNQPITASLAIIFCGATLGFLFYNFNPASIFLGEEGSTFMGFMLGGLSVLLGGKIATALLVMGIPMLDVAWVITRRMWFRTSPFKGDRKHLHFRLLDIGFSQRQTVLILYAIALTFGFVALFMQSMGKLIALIILVFVMVVLAVSSVVLYKKRANRETIQD